ncbi:HEAT repeat-containing protein 5B [Taenia crassiceps]|uniref:HEAT repeat-containing protein 5B n=1 Tax=Taenia crassiceps TaxID=6207 RepID=A0ABR4QR24_9CEST
MDAHPGLLLNDAAFARVPEQNKPVFIYDWLRSLDRRLSQSTKTEVRDVQQALTDQLMSQVTQGVGPPSRKLLGRCLAKIFTTGDSISLYAVLNSCNDVLKVRDDSPTTINKRLTALTCLGVIYRSLGRLCGRSFEETVGILTKMIKQVESQTRSEILTTLMNIVTGLGAAETACFRDIFKVARSFISDRVLAVRLAAVQCLNSLTQYHSHFFTSDLDAVMSMCIKGLDGSNHAVRMEIAKFLGFILAKTQLDPGGFVAISNGNSVTGNTSAGGVLSNQNLTVGRNKPTTLDDIFTLLSSAFLRGPSRFHKGSNGVSREVRAGITYVYLEFLTNLGSDWLVAHSYTMLSHCLSLLTSPRTTSTPSEAAFTRLCLGGYLLPRLLRRHFSEAAQVAVARHLLVLFSMRIRKRKNPSQQGQTQLRGLGKGLRPVSSAEQLDEQTTGSPIGSGSGGGSEDGSGGASTGGGSGGSSGGGADDPNYLICCLDVLTEVIRWLDSSVAPILSSPSNLVDTLFEACLCNTYLGVRVAAAAVLRQLAIALPSQRVPLMDRCMGVLSSAASADSISGHSLALGGLVAGSQLGELGIPCAKGKAVFSLAEDLLRAANQNSRLTMARTHAGWYLLGACMALGPTAVRPHLPRLILLWRNAFPRSTRELEAEKQRGDAFTWQVTLEARAGALCSMQAFLEYCAPAMAGENVARRLLSPLECALNLLAQMPDIVRAFGNHLAVPAALLRLRLYRCLALLPPSAYSGSFNVLLRELVAEFTLTDSSATTAVCLAGLLGQSEDSVVLNSWCRVSDQQLIEDAIEQHNYCCPGSLWNDTAYLFLQEGLLTAMTSDTSTVEFSLKFILEGQPDAPLMSSHKQSCIRFTASDSITSSHFANHQHRGQGPPALSSQVIEASINLFGLVFPFVSTRHRIQMLEHFTECIRVSKAARQEAIQVNIFAALLCALRHLSETKYAFGEDKNLRAAAVSLTMSALSSSNAVLRFTAAECVGRLAQVVGEAGFLADVAQTSFDQLRCLRDSQARAAGLCAAIGCLHRFVGGLACGQHLSTSVSVLLAVAQDSSAPTVQAWALNSLALTAESGGPMFREFVQPSLNLVLRLLLKTPSTVIDIHNSLANLLGALITTLGPDLQSSGGGGGGGIANFQRIHVFAPHLVNLSLFAPFLSASMTSSCFALRRAAIACIRQISQKDPDNLCTFMVSAPATPLYSATSTTTTGFIGNLPGEKPVASTISTNGTTEVSAETVSLPLEAVLFSLLDMETDSRLRSHLEEAISSLLQARGLSHFSGWMRCLKQLLQLTTSKFNATREGVRKEASSLKPQRSLKQWATDDGNSGNANDTAEEEDADEDDDEQTLGANAKSRDESFNSADTIFSLPPRWPTRILAIACLRRLMCLCHQAAELATAAPLSTSATATEIGLRSPQLSRELPITPLQQQQRAHFDLVLARKLRSGLTDAPWLVLHLADLVRMTFIAATANSDHLRRFGLFALKQIIQFFAPVVDPDSTGTYLLEQFQAQISAALSPAFITVANPASVDSSLSPSSSTAAPLPDITAAACEVCACWLTSGVPREAADLRRVHDLLTASLEILRAPPSSTSASTALFSEACVTRLKLAVLTAWAEVFIAAARFRETALQTLQLLSMLESSGRESSSDGDVLGDVVQRQFFLMLAGGGACSGNWAQPSVNDASKLLEVLEKEADSEDEFIEEEEYQGEEEDEVLNEDKGECSGSVDVKRKRFIRKSRHAVTESRHSYQLLSRLIGEDLAELASDWLAALRDFALINLPDELAFQRPSTAGAFYDTQTGIEQVRPFYARSWLSLLEAAALCLNTEAKCAPKLSYSSHVVTEKLTVVPMTRDSFFLIFGIAIEAISDVISKPPTSVVAKCLRIVELLFMNPQSHPYFFSSTPRLLVELLSVLHRIILTRDSVSLHLACLRVLHLLLAAADKRLRTALAATLNPTRNDNIGTDAEAIPVWLETGQSLEELLAVLLCPCATDMEVVLKAFELADGGPKSCFEESSDSSCRLVLAILQVIVCLLARYHPSVLLSPVTEQTSSLNASPIFPKSTAARHRKAPVILASAIHALTALLRITSPDILSINPDKKVSGVLPVMCRLVSRIAQLELLKPSHVDSFELRAAPSTNTTGLDEEGGAADSASLESTSTMSAIGANATSTSTAAMSGPPDLGTISASAFKTATTAETDITSTSSGTNDTVYSTAVTAAEAATFSAGGRSCASLNAKLGWNQEQACLADALVAFLATVAQHHCRPVSATTSAFAAAAADTTTSTDASSDVTVEMMDDAVSSSTPPSVSQPRNAIAGVFVSESGDTPACDWHQLVIACLLTFIQHDHVAEDATKTVLGKTKGGEIEYKRTARCCLTAACLSARVIAAAPLAVFRCRAVEFGIFDLLTRAWREASSPASPQAPLSGATTRTVCLAAIEMLVNHHDADVSSCCVKTLMPQVFHWLYELSLVTATTSGVSLPIMASAVDVFDELQSPISQQQARRLFLASLEEAVSAAIALSVNVVDIAEASGRQNLLIILLPLFCDLLYDTNAFSNDDNSVNDGMMAVRQMLHGLALKNLLALGSRYPAEFRHVVAKVGSLKPRIEAAVKSSTTATGTSTSATSTKKGTMPASQQLQQHQQQPRAAIKLKMEFSNFT